MAVANFNSWADGHQNGTQQNQSVSGGGLDGNVYFHKKYIIWSLIYVKAKYIAYKSATRKAVAVDTKLGPSPS